jgi:hypothetical protein
MNNYSQCNFFPVWMVWFVAAAVLVISSSCGLSGRPQTQSIGDLGYFEYRAPRTPITGVVIVAPYGGSRPQAAILARQIADSTGAGLVIAYGFKSRRVSVAQPVTRTHAARAIHADWARRGSVFREFKQVLRQVSDGEVDLYIELRIQDARTGSPELQVASSGFTFEEAKAIKEFYSAAFDVVSETKAMEKLPLSIDLIDPIGTDAWGIRHHGALMVTEKGLSLGIPKEFLEGKDLTLFGEVLSVWLHEVTRLLRAEPRGLPRIEVKLTDFGRLDSIPSRAGRKGIVIGAPHGSYDAYTAEIVTQLALYTGFSAVIARGFTPTECGDGRRINVNRPTERHVSASEREFETERARKTYEQFKSSVKSAAKGSLELYVDIHHNNGSRIEVATVGLSREEALIIKNAYRSARDQIRADRSDVVAVELAIEPLDELEVGAWAAKSNGILSVASRSLHFELPAHVVASAQQREMYTRVLAQLIRNLPAPVN